MALSNVRERLIALARIVLVWERLTDVLWPPVALLLAFVTVALLDLLPGLQAWQHGLLLCAVAAGFVVLVTRARKRFAWPDRASARRRVQADSALPDRPLDALDDRSASGGGAAGAALWAAHRARMANSTDAATVSWPRAQMVTVDPYGLRVVLAIALVVGGLEAGGDAGTRLVRALLPHTDHRGAVPATSFDIWITPPEYTGLPPIYLNAGAPAYGADVSAPLGSKLLAQVHGGGTPELHLGGHAVPFAGSDADDYSVTAKLGDADALAIAQDGSTIARYALHIIPDQPPSASWTGPAQATPRGALRLAYEAKDDYGVTSLDLVIALTDGSEAPIQVPLVTGGHAKDLKSTVYQDLTSNPWAGQPVELQLVAHDALGQTGSSEALRTVLPERIFHNPVAQAVIKQRKRLLSDPQSEPDVADALNAISDAKDSFNGDVPAFLGLRAATYGLLLDRDGESIRSIAGLLWDTALRIEEGQVPEAQKNLRQAEQALRDALDRNASDGEIDALTRQLQQAMAQYLRSMVQNALNQNGQQPPSASSGGKSISAQDLKQLLDQARELAKSGARDAAQATLDKLRDILESLRMGPPRSASNGAGQQMMSQLQNLAGRQQSLIDKSFQAGRSNNSEAGTGPLADEQESLRKALGDMMHQMGDAGGVGQSLSRAERSMQSATDALRHGGDPLNSQGEALKQLQEAARSIQEQAQEGQGQDSEADGSNDPFGRNGAIDDGTVKIPTQSDMQRSREILEELRRRAAERMRPEQERDYIDRLLDRF